MVSQTSCASETKSDVVETPSNKTRRGAELMFHDLKPKTMEYDWKVGYARKHGGPLPSEPRPAAKSAAVVDKEIIELSSEEEASKEGKKAGGGKEAGEKKS